MRSHSVTCHPAEVTFPPLPQPKLVLDLATPEGCKAELTWVVVISQDSLSAKYGYLRSPYVNDTFCEELRSGRAAATVSYTEKEQYKRTTIFFLSKNLRQPAYPTKTGK